MIPDNDNGNILEFPIEGEIPEVTPEDILEKSLDVPLKDVLVLGWDHDGFLYLASNMEKNTDLLWIVEKMKTLIL